MRIIDSITTKALSGWSRIPSLHCRSYQDQRETFYFEEVHVHAAGAWAWTYNRHNTLAMLSV
jgi:hypothetical protein